jgi:hypothetical protein
MSEQKKRIFVSYSHRDNEWCELFQRQLKSVHDPLEYDIWIDAGRIEVGSQWRARIEQGLRDTDAALLLISDNFLSSDFIRNKQQAPLLARRDAGMLLVPVLVGACPWKQIAWLEGTQMRPSGDKPLEQIGRPGSPKAKQVAMEIVNELTRLLKSTQADAAPPAAAVATDKWSAAASRLLGAVLLQAQDDETRVRLAAQLVERIAALSGLAGEALFRAVRLFVEFHLLRSDEPSSPRALLASCAALPADKTARVLIDSLKRGAASGDYSEVAIGVSSMFFMHAREREPQWQAYFDALRERDGAALAEDEVGSLARIDVQWGFIAPQFLVAGLMSRFDDDWRPVLGVYRQSLPKPGARDGGFANLQASQWNCWLVWGPSVPICRCLQWGGHYAFQYGYGDENNSLPLLDTQAGPGESVLDELAQQIVQQGQGAGVAKLTGRLRWGPYLLRAADAADGAAPLVDADDDGFDDIDPADDDPDQPPARPLRKLVLADAQAALLCGDGLTHAGHSDGLLLELHELQPAAAPRAYFSAYFWLMFLVAGPLQGDAGPRLLWRRRWPDWPEPPADRAAVRAVQLWRDLLPVFVHANVADAQALAFQRRALVDSALATLRTVWRTRHDNFDAQDVEAGIRFHLVCASDYSGCGEPIRYRPPEQLATLLRERLADEPDREFAASVVLPPDDETAATRPWGLAGYFSSCHLNELVADYYDHVARLNLEKTASAAAAKRRA